MIIRDILKSKGTNVETIWPERTIANVLTRFDERNISSVIVTDHAGRPIGIVTDRDVLRLVARRGAAALQATVAQVMQSPAPTCTPESTVTDVMHQMTFDRVRHVVVVDGQRNLNGVVSIGDLVKSRLQDADLESRVLRERTLGLLAAE